MSETERRSAARAALRAPLAALTLLTILPVPAKLQRHIGAREVAASAPFFPLVGALLGLAVGLIAYAASERSSGLLPAAVAVVLIAAVTGALHLDGLADSADALGARGGSKERRLEIMRDSSNGAYGTAAVAGWFVLVTAAVATLRPDELAITLAWAFALSRTVAVAHARLLPSARVQGLGAGFRMSTLALVAAVVVLAGLAALFVVIGPQASDPAYAALFVDGATVTTRPLGGAFEAPSATVLAISAAAALVAGALVSLAARRLIGGRTGDTLGATIALTEAAALLGAALATG